MQKKPGLAPEMHEPIHAGSPRGASYTRPIKDGVNRDAHIKSSVESVLKSPNHSLTIAFLDRDGLSRSTASKVVSDEIGRYLELDLDIPSRTPGTCG